MQLSVKKKKKTRKIQEPLEPMEPLEPQEPQEPQENYDNVKADSELSIHEADKNSYRDFMNKLEADVVNHEPSVNTEIILWPTLTDSVLENSDFEDESIQIRDSSNPLKIEDESIQIRGSSSPVNVEAINEEDLERIGVLDLAEKHAHTYTKFNGYVQKVKDSDFYQRMLDYKKHYFEGQLLTIKLEILKDSCKEISGKCWNLVSKQAQFDQECGDGTLLRCFTTIDSAVFSHSKAAELIKVNCQTLEMCKELQFNDYLTNVAKLYIQNYLDVFLQDFLELLLSYSTFKDKMDGWDTFQMIVAVLFEFLKVDNSDKDLNVFIKDCRMWSTQIITCLRGSFSFLDSRIILLHVLRTKGIGNWGRFFVQWNDSYTWNDDVLEHYLISLTCLLSPVEELESRIKSKLESIAYLEEELKKLEQEDWIVVFDDDLPDDVASKRSNSRLKFKSIILLESDYLGILSQFQVKNVFETLCCKFTHEKDRSLLQLISIAHHICLIIIRGIHVIPKDYVEVIRHLGDHVSFVVNKIVDCLAEFIENRMDILISGQLQSSIVMELDALMERLFLRLSAIKGKPMWDTISTLPMDKCTARGRLMISKSLVSIFRGNIKIEPSEAGYICKVTRNLFLSSSSLNSISNFEIDWDCFSSEIVKSLYHLTCVNNDTRLSFAKYGTACIHDICSQNPELMSYILNWIRDDINQLELIDIKNFCSQLAWNNFRAQKIDLLVLQGMLRDPENTPKAQIAMFVLGLLNWGYSPEGSLGLFIPRYLHREIGIMVINLYLDRMGHFGTESISSTINATVEKSFQNSLGFRSESEIRFNEWIWKLIVKLKLYQKPSATDIYPADSLETFSKPFLSLESTALLSLRSTMNSEPLSAYMLLMISDIGHQLLQFKVHALNLLSILCVKAKYEAILMVFCYMLPSFILDTDFLQDFSSVINGLFVQHYTSDNFDGLREIFQEYIERLHQSEKEDIMSAIDFWHKLVYFSPNNVSSELGMLILDSISKMCFQLDMSKECQESLGSILKSRVAEYNISIEKEIISIKNPVASVYSIKNYFTRKYPELVPPIEYQCKYSESRSWFAIDGYLAEVRSTSNERKLIGSQLCINGMLDETGSAGLPPNSYTIYRLAKEFLILKPNHFLAPIYLDLFLSLYFESDSPTQIFGHLTLMDFKKTSVETVVNFIKKSARSLDELGDKCGDGLRNAYNSFLLWLYDPNLLTDGLLSRNISKDYLVHRLECCLKGHILKSGKCSWSDILLPLTEEENGFSKQNLGPEKLQVTYLALAPLLPPKSSPIFPLHTPLFGKFSMNIDTIRSKVADAIKILSTKADEYLSINKTLNRIEFEYVEKLKLLYTSSSIRNRTQKTCGKECKSPAIFDYITYKILAVSEVKLMLLDNRATKESYINNEGNDSKTSALGLEIKLILEWLQKIYIDDLDRSIWSDIFFVILEAIIQNQNLSEFPISKYIFRNLLNSFGRNFISISAENNLKLWEYMKKPIVIEMAAGVFSPSFAPQHFIVMYKDLCSRFEMLGDHLFQTILANFDVLNWLTGGVSNDQRFELFKSLIGWPFSVDSAPTSFTTNRKLLGDLLSHPSFLSIIPDAIGVSFSNILSKPCSVILFSDVADAIFLSVPDTWQACLDNLDLLECNLGREQLVTLIGHLNITLKQFIVTKEKSVLNFNKETQNAIVRLLALLICSKQLYSMMISFYFEELYSILLSIYLAIIGIVFENNSWKYVATWPLSDIENSKTMVLNLNRILEKFCRNSSQMSKAPATFWEIISIILQLNLPEEVVEFLVSTFESSSVWQHFSLSVDEIISIKCWIDGKKMSLSLMRCICKILEFSYKDISRLFPTNATQQHNYPTNIQDFLYIIVYIVNQSQSIWPDLNDRVRMFSVLNRNFFHLPWFFSIKEPDFASSVESFSKFKWNTSTSQLSEWESNGDPLVFTIKVLQSAGGIQRDSCSSGCYVAYKEFLLSLLSSHIFSKDTWNEAFSDDHITNIVFDFLSQAEEFKIHKLFESTGIGFFGFKDLVGVFNRMSKNHDLYVKVWNGCLRIISVSKIPLEYLSCSSYCFSSVDCMALFNEKCIDRFLEIQGSSVEWENVSKALIVPQLSIEQYVKCCLDNALLLQLFLYSLQELKESPQVDSKLLIGEQMAAWLNSFKSDNLDFGCEGKIAPLLYLFSLLLCTEMGQTSVASHARLLSMVPNIANSLIKLSEDRVSGGLWSTLGFGPKSKYSIEFRFFCRIVGAFMASRVLPTHERTKLVESVESLHSNSEYESLLLYLDPVMDNYLLSKADLSALPDLIRHETMALFESYFVGPLAI